MGLRGVLFAALYDRATARAESAGLGDLRRRLLGGAAGRVLEIGAGTGANLPHYGPAVTALTLAEPAAPMRRRLEARAAREAPGARVIDAVAESLPLPDDSIDTVVSTLVLCGAADPAAALGEARRVLVPGGRLLVLEHVRSDDPALARRQDRLRRLNRAFTCCDCNRRTLDAIRAAGFDITEVDSPELDALPSLVRPLIVGAAAAPMTRER